MTRKEFKSKVAAMIGRQTKEARIVWTSVAPIRKTDKVDGGNSWRGWRAEIEFSAPGFMPRKVIATHRKGCRVNETEVMPVTSWAHLVVGL